MTLTRSGHLLLRDARALIAHADEVADRVRSSAAGDERVFRIGAMDSAATGLIPQLLHDFREIEPDLELVLIEAKKVRDVEMSVHDALKTLVSCGALPPDGEDANSLA